MKSDNASSGEFTYHGTLVAPGHYFPMGNRLYGSDYFYFNGPSQQGGGAAGSILDVTKVGLFKDYDICQFSRILKCSDINTEI